MEVLYLKKRRYRTKEERIKLYNNYIESNLSKKAWCSLNNIPPSTFDAWRSLATKEDTNDLVFISPKPKADREKEIKASISKNRVNGTETLPFNTILEIGICKLHINETTPFSFIEQIIKVVKEANV